MRRLGKFLLIAVLVVAAGYALLCGALYAAMCQPPDTFGQIMARMPRTAFLVLPFERLWFSARAGSLEVGDPAPDFELPTAEGTARVRLSSFQGQRPVVLVFGSYT